MTGLPYSVGVALALAALAVPCWLFRRSLAKVIDWLVERERGAHAADWWERRQALDEPYSAAGEQHIDTAPAVIDSRHTIRTATPGRPLTWHEQDAFDSIEANYHQTAPTPRSKP